MNKKQEDFIFALHSKHAKQMAQLVYRRTGDAELAKDMVQETFLVACCKPEQICNHENPAGWLYLTLSHLTARALAKTYRAAETPLIEDITIGEYEIELPLSAYLPKGLSQEDKDLIVMRVQHKLPYDEIAGKRGITEVACRKQASRAFEKCRLLMTNEKDNKTLVTDIPSQWIYEQEVK